MELKLPWIISLQLLIWAGYTTVIIMSNKDGWTAEAILLIVFVYFSYLITDYVTESKRFALYSSLLVLLVNILIKQFFFT